MGGLSRRAERVCSARAPRGSRAGGALAFVLIVVTAVAVMTAGILSFSSHVSRRQAQAVADKRAFYLAEAGLAEAYFGLRTGKTGQLGSLMAPTRVDGGLVWVDATETAEGNVRLRSTGMSGIGRASLELVVEPVAKPLGIFSRSDLELDVPVLVDGYDSTKGSYESQAVRESEARAGLRIDWSALHLDEPGWVQRWELPPDHESYLPFEEVTIDPSVAQEVLDVYLARDPARELETFDLHTGGGARLTSNGDLTLGETAGTRVEVWGDVAPGPEGVVHVGPDGKVSGATQPQPEARLDRVHLPYLDLLPPLKHAGAVPLTLPPGRMGYRALSVAAGSQLVIEGPAVLVLGSLRLADGAELVIDNAGGPVQILVEETVDLKPGSSLTVVEEDPRSVSLLVEGRGAPVRLRADSHFHGTVYAPESSVEVGSGFEIFGSLAAKAYDFDPWSRLHYDQATHGGGRGLDLPEVISWRITGIPPEVRPGRGDPFRALGLDPEGLVALPDAHESASWTFEVWYWNVDGNLVHYAGPYEKWDPLRVSTYVGGTARLIPPTVPLSRDWHLEVSYRTPWGTDEVYEGPVSGYDMSRVVKIHYRILTPPPELATGGRPVEDEPPGNPPPDSNTGGKE